jgi:HAD superfamily hydrolase (TIGR01459 family)
MTEPAANATKLFMTQNFKHIIPNYDAFIVDLWGVIHDGDKLYPGVAATLQHLQEEGKQVVFLSNAPRVAAKAERNLEALHISAALYQNIVTSGQVAHDLLSANPTRRKYYYLGPSKDEDVLADVLHITRTDDTASADFILCTGYERDGQPHEEIIPVLKKLFPLPLLCINPDMEVVKQDGTQFLCAGAVAAEYTAEGGKVAYIGKPFPEVYAAARALFDDNARILCVGDNPATDIKGANDAKLDSLLITGGVMQVRYGAITEAQAREICTMANISPTYVLPGFSV